jgi:GDP/UDP-N,N'-diacetylbacillosamine 2-epimerase (hydrolysing)
VDDALRHAITKLAHLHFSATRLSAERILKMGEDRWRVHRVGSPGIDGIARDAAGLGDVAKKLAAEAASPLKRGRYAVLVLHPTDADDPVERERAELLLGTSLSVPFENVVVVYPNNDPGSAGIVGCWDEMQRRVYRATPAQLARQIFARNLPRPAFLGLMRDAAVLVGNSSSGIIEAASFGTPAVDVGPRQAGRERGANVTSVPFTASAIRRALRAIWNDGRPRRYPKRNIYGGADTGARIARVLATVKLDERLRRKLIAY